MQKRMSVLYDLSDEVAVDEEDMAVFSMVWNNGASEALDRNLIVSDGSGLYMVRKPSTAALRLGAIIRALSIVLLVLSAVTLFLGLLVVITCPGVAPFWPTVGCWVLAMVGLFLTGKMNY